MDERERLVWQTAANSRGNEPSIEIISPLLYIGKKVLISAYPCVCVCWEGAEQLPFFLFCSSLISPISFSFDELTSSSQAIAWVEHNHMKMTSEKTTSNANYFSGWKTTTTNQIPENLFCFSLLFGCFKRESLERESPSKVQKDHWRVWPVSSSFPLIFLFICL